MRAIWNGKGEVGDAAYFTKNNGEVVGRPYVRDRARRELAGWAGLFSLADRRAALERTVDSDAWLSFRNGSTVGSIVRDVVESLLTEV